MNNNQSSQESLFLNAIRFQFPEEPQTFYFLHTTGKRNFPFLTHHNKPIELEVAFPDFKNGDKIYSTFEVETNGFTPVKIDLRDPRNFAFAKRYYNRLIYQYFVSKNFLIETNKITKDNQIWFRDGRDNPYPECIKYDRFTLRVNYDRFNNTPQLVITYDRPTWVYKYSVAKIMQSSDDPFSPIQPSAELFGKVVYRRKDKFTKFIVDKYSSISLTENFDSNAAYPIMNRELINYLQIEFADEDETEEPLSYKKTYPRNKYKRYFDKISAFYKTINNDEFRKLINIEDGFAKLNPLQIGHTNSASRSLMFGGNTTNYNPQIGVNHGPFQPTPYPSITMLAIFPKEDREAARNLLRYFKNDYKQLFKGLKLYIGRDFSFSNKFLEIQDTNNILGELNDFLRNMTFNHNEKIIAIYLTPIGRHTSDKEERKIYYRVKERLLRYNIVSQCIETSKMLSMIEHDNTNTDSNGKPLKNFAYTLQNMSIAINAKLGGTPWRLSSPKQDELIVGVGAFRNTETNTQYIGSAFSFDNTGSFNSFAYFLNDELEELAGSIENAILKFAVANGKPQRLIIHYYKTMNHKEIAHIEKALHNLNLDIPFYVLSINKIESEDYVVFDDNYKELMPYSGTYVNLGDKTYLLCNNTRYENARLNPYDGYPFPIKIKIDCPNDPMRDIDTTTINQLIDQVYQFSRIYWKSVKQQNLPVTIKYPEMIAQMLPYFNDVNNYDIDTNHLWFL